MTNPSPFSIFPLNRNIKGILWMILAGLFFSSMVGLIKLLGHKIPSYEIAFFRSLIQLLILVIIFLRIGFSALKTERPLFHGLRTLIAIVVINCNFYAFTQLPIAEVTAIGFSRNLFLTVFAIPILAEKVSVSRMTAALFGFVGILLISRPELGTIEGAMFIAVFAAALGAIMLIMIRKLAMTDSNVVMMTYPALGIVLVTSIPTFMFWIQPTYYEFFLLILMSFLGTIGQWSMIQALRLGEATAIASAGYTRIIFATLIGYSFFAELPDLISIFGISIIVASNVLLIRREGREDNA